MDPTSYFTSTHVLQTSFSTNMKGAFGVGAADWMQIFSVVVPLLLLLLIVAFGWRFVLQSFKAIVHRFRGVG